MAFLGDLQTDMKLDCGNIKCHSTTDLVLTQSGDLALIADGSSGMRQRLLIWLAVPQGELFDPNSGCPSYDFFHTRLTRENMKSFANALLNSFQYTFPEINVQNVEVTKTDYQTVFIEVYAGTNAFAFLYSLQDANMLSKNMWSTWAQNNLVPFFNQSTDYQSG
jgi:hypothetical protein